MIEVPSFAHPFMTKGRIWWSETQDAGFLAFILDCISRRDNIILLCFPKKKKQGKKTHPGKKEKKA